MPIAVPAKKTAVAAPKAMNAVQHLFAKVKDAVVGTPRLDPGRYVLAVESVNVAYTNKDGKVYIKGEATVAIPIHDGNKVPYGSDGYSGHAPGDVVSFAIFSGNYFDKEAKKFLMAAFNIGPDQVGDDDIYTVCGLESDGATPTGQQPLYGRALEMAIVSRLGKKEKPEDPDKWYNNNEFIRSWAADEVLAAFGGDEALLKERFPDGVTEFDFSS